VRRSSLLLALLLAGCGSRSLPPAATPVHSPPARVAPTPSPFGESQPIITETPGPVRVDRRRDLLISHGRSARTCREPVDFAYYDSDRLIAVLCGRDRVVQLFDATSLKPVAKASAGTGPARIATDGRADLYVTDVVADALLVYHLHPRFELIRRVDLPGGPWAIAHDPGRSALWITLTGLNRVVEFADGSRPVQVRSYPTVRQPNELAVVGTDLLIDGRQLLSPPQDRARPTG
jgi:hypothetical protein